MDYLNFFKKTLGLFLFLCANLIFSSVSFGDSRLKMLKINKVTDRAINPDIMSPKYKVPPDVVIDPDKYRVSGTLEFYDERYIDDAHTIPVRDFGYYGAHNVMYRIYDEDSGDDDLLASGVLGSEGSFDASFSFNQSEEDYPDVYVVFYFGNTAWEIIDKNDEIYVLETNTQNNINSYYDFGNVYVNPDNQLYSLVARAFQTLNEAWLNITTKASNLITEKVRLSYDEDLSSGGFLNGIINIPYNEGYEENFDAGDIYHEFGHVISYQLWQGSTITKPADCDYGYGGDTTESHSYESQEYPCVAFSEGWANFIEFVNTGACSDTNNDYDLREENSYGSS